MRAVPRLSAYVGRMFRELECLLVNGVGTWTCSLYGDIAELIWHSDDALSRIDSQSLLTANQPLTVPVSFCCWRTNSDYGLPTLKR